MPVNQTDFRSTRPSRCAANHAAAVPFEAEPYDLVAEMPKFAWPTVVVSGGRDLITPSAVAERIGSLIPGAMLIRLADHGAQRAGQPPERCAAHSYSSPPRTRPGVGGPDAGIGRTAGAAGSASADHDDRRRDRCRKCAAHFEAGHRIGCAQISLG